MKMGITKIKEYDTSHVNMTLRFFENSVFIFCPQPLLHKNTAQPFFYIRYFPSHPNYSIKLYIFQVRPNPELFMQSERLYRTRPAS